jgi:hypothetical protein
VRSSVDMRMSKRRSTTGNASGSCLTVVAARTGCRVVRLRSRRRRGPDRRRGRGGRVGVPQRQRPPRSPA